MPTYQYACTVCGDRSEAVQAFSDAPLTECQVCGGALRKVYSSVGVVFKGSGFYRNDSRPKESGGEKSDAPKADAKTDAKTDAKSGGGDGSGGATKNKEGAPSAPAPAKATPAPAAKSG